MIKIVVKNNIITILFIIAVIFLMVGQFSPVSYYIHSEYTNQTYNDLSNTVEWKFYSYDLFQYSCLQDNSYVNIGEKPLLAEKLLLFHFFIIYLSNDEISNVQRPDLFEPHSYKYARFELYLFHIFAMFAFVLALLALYYFVKLLKELKKPSKIPLILGLLILLGIISLYLYTLFTIINSSSDGLSRAKYVHLDYGFYYQMIGVIILFIIYFIQNKPRFLKEKKELKE